MTRIGSRALIATSAIALGAIMALAGPARAQDATTIGGSTVGGLGGGTVVQGSNSSIGAVAVSGPAIGGNAAVANAGPSARSLLGVANAQQLGNNTTVVNQHNNVKSGDAVAGSQVTGVVGGGPTVVQNQNSSIGAVALSGPAIGGNAVAAGSGPSARTVVGVANAQQAGNNRTVVNQRNDVKSGDAVAGSQVTGVVGGGPAVVQGSNSSFLSVALSGPALGGNLGVVTAGPSARSLLGFANASQLGNNSAVLLQSNRTRSGDAIAGSQVNGVVAGFGSFVGGSNNALFPFGFSGLATGANVALGGAGPSAGPTALGGANTSQTGNNTTLGDQDLDMQSGDGVSGSQINGLVTQQRGALEAEQARAPGRLEL